MLFTYVSYVQFGKNATVCIYLAVSESTREANHIIILPHAPVQLWRKVEACVSAIISPPLPKQILLPEGRVERRSGGSKDVKHIQAHPHAII